jgi:hypothetical protein
MRGWRKGYLPERAWIFALAVFLHLRKQSPEDARLHLKPYLIADLGKALRSHKAWRFEFVLKTALCHRLFVMQDGQRAIVKMV